MAEAQKLKIDQIIEWLEKSDYYQILNIPKNANSDQMKTAYFALSRQYHPDKYYAAADKQIQTKFTIVFKRIAEAYRILKDSEKRGRYDKLLAGPDRQQHLRYQPGEEDREGPANPEDEAKTANGKKYLKLALVAQKRKDWRTAEMNLNFAIKFEPENDYMKKMMQHVLAEIKKLPKEDHFKIR